MSTETEKANYYFIIALTSVRSVNDVLAGMLRIGYAFEALSSGNTYITSKNNGSVVLALNVWWMEDDKHDHIVIMKNVERMLAEAHISYHMLWVGEPAGMTWNVGNVYSENNEVSDASFN